MPPVNELFVVGIRFVVMVQVFRSIDNVSDIALVVSPVIKLQGEEAAGGRVLNYKTS